MSEYGAAPSPQQPGQPQPAGQPVPPAPAAQPPPAKSGVAKKVLGIVGIIVVALVIFGIKFGIRNIFDSEDPTAKAKVGDCMAKLPEVATGQQKEANDAKIVDCGSGDAAYEVIGRVENQTEAQAKDGTACDQFVQEGEEYYVFSNIEPGKTGYLLCLKARNGG